MSAAGGWKHAVCLRGFRGTGEPELGLAIECVRNWYRRIPALGRCQIVHTLLARFCTILVGTVGRVSQFRRVSAFFKEAAGFANEHYRGSSKAKVAGTMIGVGLLVIIIGLRQGRDIFGMNSWSLHGRGALTLNLILLDAVQGTLLYFCLYQLSKQLGSRLLMRTILILFVMTASAAISLLPDIFIHSRTRLDHASWYVKRHFQYYVVLAGSSVLMLLGLWREIRKRLQE